MTDLLEFLRARLDEDEREIRLVLQPGGPIPQLSISHRAMHMVLTHELEAAWPTGSPRMFVDIESKRRIVDAYETAVAEFADSGPAMASYDRLTGSVSSLRHALALLALPYADHEDFREEWRP